MIGLLYHLTFIEGSPCSRKYSRLWVHVCACTLSHFSRVWLFAILWTIARQAPLCMGFFRQEYWSGLSCPPPGDLPNPGTEPVSLMFPALAGRFFTTSATWEAQLQWTNPLTPLSAECTIQSSSHWQTWATTLLFIWQSTKKNKTHQ